MWEKVDAFKTLFHGEWHFFSKTKVGCKMS